MAWQDGPTGFFQTVRRFSSSFCARYIGLDPERRELELEFWKGDNCEGKEIDTISSIKNTFLGNIKNGFEEKCLFLDW